MCCVVCAALLGVAVPALSDPQAAPLSAQSTSLSGAVRVYLSSLSGQTSLTLTVDGSYSINGDASRMLARGGSVRVSFESGQLYLTINGSRQNMGARFTLRRHQGSGVNGLKIAQSSSPNSWYNGDFEFAVLNGRMYTIVHVYMEDYIHGVLPYEMGSSFPLEALKAQAVAARTYTVQAMNRGGANYDVVDTTADQVYRGVSTSGDRTEQAATATAGVVAMHNGQFVGGYYSASNGGQTEAVKNAWGNSSFPYLGVQDDPYDLANPSSPSRSFIVYGNATLMGPLEPLLKSKVASQFTALGTATSAGSVSIAGISNVAAHTPMYPVPSRLYTKVDITALASPFPGGSHTAVTVTFDFFSELKSLLGLGINSTRNELLTVEPSGSNFILRTRRFGHGIGMSQRGAQQMANQGLSYQQIIGFYYPGCNLVKYSFSGSVLSNPGGTDAPQATAPPQQPVDGDRSGATVTLSNPASWLNLRQSPSTGAAILAQLMHGQQLKVLTTDGVWCQVQHGALTGYVMQDFLTFAQANNEDNVTADPPGEAAPTPPPNEPPSGSADEKKDGWAVVAVPDGTTLNLRLQPSALSSILLRMPNRAQVQCAPFNDAWAQVRYNGVHGYAMRVYLAPLGEAPTQPAPDPGGAPQPGGTATVNLLDSRSKLNFRAAAGFGSRVIATIPHGATVEIVQYATDWCAAKYLGSSGYLSTAYLLFSADPGEAPSATPEATAPPASSGELVVSATSLNLRASPSTSAKLLAQLPQGARLTQLEQLAGWYKVRWITMEGYVSAAYVRPAEGAPASAAPDLQPTPPAATPSAPASAAAFPEATATPTPTPPGAPAAGHAPVNSGAVTPANGEIFAEGYQHWEDKAPSVKIPAGSALDVLAYAGKDAEWCEIVFFGERFFVRTEDLKLERAVKP